MSSLPKMNGVDTSVCGTKVIAQDSPELNELPVFICGAVNNTDPPGLPKLRNVDQAICGEKAITTGAAELTQIPAFICGLVGSTDTSARDDVSGRDVSIAGNVATNNDNDDGAHNEEVAIASDDFNYLSFCSHECRWN